MYPDPQREIFGPKTLLYIGHDMCHYLAKQGVMPILIPDFQGAHQMPGEDEQLFQNFLEQMDGFLFQGGTDVTPELYGETPEHFRWQGDPQRDQYELKILKFALGKQKPVLAICRGMQLLNVHLGGTLYQDLETQLPQAAVHNCEKKYDHLLHEITFTPQGKLEQLYAHESQRRVNSVHHQGIKQLGAGLQVEARCQADQLIEAVSYGEHIWGIQWHPEFFHGLEGQTISPEPLLQKFLHDCQKTRHLSKK